MSLPFLLPKFPLPCFFFPQGINTQPLTTLVNKGERILTDGVHIEITKLFLICKENLQQLVGKISC